MLLNLFRRPLRTAPVRRARLSLETLDGRWAPSDANPLDPPDAGTGPIAAPPQDKPPEIKDFAYTSAGGNQFTFTGRVIDEKAPGLVITFGGCLWMDGQTTTVLSNGTFSTTVQFPQNISGSSLVTAVTKDTAGQDSNLAYLTVSY